MYEKISDRNDLLAVEGTQMKEYAKPQMEIIVLSGDVIETSCPSDKNPIVLPEI
jgi:hypothetical protein